MSFNFNNLNSFRQWEYEPDYDTSDASNYRKLEEVYDDPDTVYEVRGCFINPKTNYNSKITRKKEAAVLILDDFMVNVPDHQIMAVKHILEDEEACDAIDRGECGFKIRKYHQTEYDKDCYSITFVNIEPKDGVF